MTQQAMEMARLYSHAKHCQKRVGLFSSCMMPFALLAIIASLNELQIQAATCSTVFLLQQLQQPRLVEHRNLQLVCRVQL